MSKAGREVFFGPFLEGALASIPAPLVAASFGELILNRIVSRATIFVRKGPETEAILAALAWIGFFLLAVAFLLAVVWLLAWSIHELRNARAPGRDQALAASMAFFVIFGTIAIVGQGAVAVLAFALLFLAVTSLLATKLWANGRSWKAFVLAAWAAYGLHTLAIALAQAQSLSPTLGVGLAVGSLQRGGEIVALLTAPLLLISEIRTGGPHAGSPRIALIAAIPAAGFAFAAAANLALVANISFWSVGFSLFLPYPVYALALWSFGYAVLVARRRGDRLHLLAYLLLFAAGYNLNLTYLHFLAVVALVCLIPGSDRLLGGNQWDSRREPPPPDAVR